MKTTTPSINLRCVIATAICGALAAGGAAVCTAADTTDGLRTIVKYGDLNISNPQGANSLYTRIRAAADEVCRPYNRRELTYRKPFSDCVHKAITDAVATVNEPVLFSVYRANNKTSQPTIVATRQTH